jgi:glycosyltransferase involved in cell wall biosynthesis
VNVAIAGALTDPNARGGEPEAVKYVLKGLEQENIKYTLVNFNNALTKDQVYKGVVKIFRGFYLYDEYLKFFRERNPDVILGFTDFDSSYALAASDLGIPLILAVHTYWGICPSNNLFNWKNQDCSGSAPLKCIYCNLYNGNRVGLLNSLYSRKQERSFFAIPTKIIVPSNTVMKVLLKEGVPSEKIERIENGIDLDFWKFSELPARGPLLYLSGYSKHKGGRDFLRASEELGYLEFKGNIKAGKEKVPRNLEIFDWVSVEEVRSILNSSYALVSPALWEEPFGYVVAQAMAVGRPVVAYRSGGISEQVIDAVTGLLAEKGNFSDLLEKIKQISQDRTLAERMGREARREAERRFDYKIMAGKYANAIKDVVK